MQVTLTEEQQQFQDVLARFFSDVSDVSQVRQQMASDTGFDAGVWARLGEELGILGLVAPEAFGGGGFGPVTLGLAMHEMGRALYCGPFFGSAVLSVHALLHCARESEQARLLPDLASGRRRAALLASYAAPSIKADQERLSGHARLVVDGLAADVLLVAATQGSGVTLYEVDPQAPGVQRRALNVIDATRRLAEVRLERAPALPLGDAAEGLTRALDLSLIALANEQAGVASRVFADTLEYLDLRVQFGRKVSSFQAIKHRCADLFLDVQLAEAAARQAAAAAADMAERPDGWDAAKLAWHASQAKAATSDASMMAAAEAIQLHGGIGFTEAHHVPLWFKRAKSSEVLFGHGAWHRERMIQALSEQRSA